MKKYTILFAVTPQSYQVTAKNKAEALVEAANQYRKSREIALKNVRIFSGWVDLPM